VLDTFGNIYVSDHGNGSSMSSTTVASPGSKIVKMTSDGTYIAHYYLATTAKMAFQSMVMTGNNTLYVANYILFTGSQSSSACIMKLSSSLVFQQHIAIPYDGTLYLYDANSGTKQYIDYPELPLNIGQLALHPNGTDLYMTISSDAFESTGTILVLNLNTNQFSQLLEFTQGGNLLDYGYNPGRGIAITRLGEICVSPKYGTWIDIITNNVFSRRVDTRYLNTTDSIKPQYLIPDANGSILITSDPVNGVSNNATGTYIVDFSNLVGNTNSGISGVTTYDAITTNGGMYQLPSMTTQTNDNKIMVLQNGSGVSLSFNGIPAVDYGGNVFALNFNATTSGTQYAKVFKFGEVLPPIFYNGKLKTSTTYNSSNIALASSTYVISLNLIMHDTNGNLVHGFQKNDASINFNIYNVDGTFISTFQVSSDFYSGVNATIDKNNKLYVTGDGINDPTLLVVKRYSMTGVVEYTSYINVAEALTRGIAINRENTKLYVCLWGSFVVYNIETNGTLTYQYQYWGGFSNAVGIAFTPNRTLVVVSKGSNNSQWTITEFEVNSTTPVQIRNVSISVNPTKVAIDNSGTLVLATTAGITALTSNGSSTVFSIAQTGARDIAINNRGEILLLSHVSGSSPSLQLYK
jgi:hypothetical protein